MSSRPRSRQITTPAPHHSVFYRHDALPACQSTEGTIFRSYMVRLSYVLRHVGVTGNDTTVVMYSPCTSVPSVLWRCWLGIRKIIRPVKNRVIRCWCGYMSMAGEARRRGWLDRRRQIWLQICIVVPAVSLPGLMLLLQTNWQAVGRHSKQYWLEQVVIY